MTDRYDSHPDDYDPDNSGINLNKGVQQNQPEQPLPGDPVAQDAWPRPYAGRRAAYGPAAQESYPPAPPGYPASYNQAPPGYPASYNQAPQGERTSGLALAGFITALGSALLSLTFIFAFLGFFAAITALVLSIVGLVRDVKGKHMKGKGFALTGIIVSAVVLVLILVIALLLIAYAIAHPGSNSSCVGTAGYCDRYNSGMNI